jgi:hypothetical protein
MWVLFCIYYKQMTRWSCIFSVGAPKNVAVAPFILQGRMGLDSGAESISVELWTLKNDVSLCCRCNLYLGLYSLFHRASDIKIDISG